MSDEVTATITLTDPAPTLAFAAPAYDPALHLELTESQAFFTVSLVAPRPDGLDQTAELVRGPIRDALLKRLDGHAERARFRSLDRQAAEIMHRREVAHARVTKAEADRDLLRAEAPSDLGKKLVKANAAVADAEAALAEIGAELAEVMPLRQTAWLSMGEELRGMLPDLLDAAKARIEAELAKARADALQAVITAAGPDVLRVAQLQSTLAAMPRETDLRAEATALVGVEFEGEEDDAPEPDPASVPADAPARLAPGTWTRQSAGMPRPA